MKICRMCWAMENVIPGELCPNCECPHFFSDVKEMINHFVVIYKKKAQMFDQLKNGYTEYNEKHFGELCDNLLSTTVR